MNRYYYDLHIHSCLSPCGDNDSTPNNIAGMGELNGLNIMALTDHNTCKNCPAFFKAASRHGIVPVAGMELTTAEDIHLVCLFETLESAVDFDGFVYSKRNLIKNRTDIFGDQLILDGDDELIGTDDMLLTNATVLTLEDAAAAVAQYNGICYPAHIDREANGIISVLGGFPNKPKFNVAELHNSEKSECCSLITGLNKENYIISSDAHYLWDIKEKNEYFELDDEPYSSAAVRKSLFDFLRSL